MADRDIDSTEIDTPLLTTKVIINGIDADVAIDNAYSTLGVPVNSTNMGVITAPGLPSPNSNTVKQLAEKLAAVVEDNSADLVTLTAAIAALINDGVTGGATTYSSSKIWAEMLNLLNDPLHGSFGDSAAHKTTETYNQAVIEELISKRFDKALEDIEVMINNAI